jgi:hypothetical protein
MATSNPSASAPKPASQQKSLPKHPHDAVWGRTLKFFEEGQYEEAVKALRSLPLDWRLRNALGVALMRLDRSREAVEVFRNFVMAPGTSYLRQEVPTLYKFNFATALLLNGNPGGCLNVMSEIGHVDHPQAQLLKRAISQWQRKLPLWARLNWWLYRIQPSHVSVTLDSPPGQLDD